MKNQRNRDFIRACRRIISESRRALTAAEVAVAAASGPAPEFYISFGHAYKVLSHMRRHGLTMPREGNQAVYADLHDRVEVLMRRRRCGLAEAIALVLAAGNAPRFYLTPKSAVFLYSSLAGRRNSNKRTKPQKHNRHADLNCPVNPENN